MYIRCHNYNSHMGGCSVHCWMSSTFVCWLQSFVSDVELFLPQRRNCCTVSNCNDYGSDLVSKEICNLVSSIISAVCHRIVIGFMSCSYSLTSCFLLFY